MSSTTRILNRRSGFSEPTDALNSVPPVPTLIVGTEVSGSMESGRWLATDANLNKDGNAKAVDERADRTGFVRFRCISSEFRLNMLELEDLRSSVGQGIGCSTLEVIDDTRERVFEIVKAWTLSLSNARRREGPLGLYRMRQNPPIRSWSLAIDIIVGLPRAEDSIMKGRLMSRASVAETTGLVSSLRRTMSPPSTI